jgi:hypothetical protein
MPEMPYFIRHSSSDFYGIEMEFFEFFWNFLIFFGIFGIFWIFLEFLEFLWNFWNFFEFLEFFGIFGIFYLKDDTNFFPCLAPRVFRREKIENIPKNKDKLCLSLSHFRFSLTHYSGSGSERENQNLKKTGIVRSYFLGYFLFFSTKNLIQRQKLH